MSTNERTVAGQARFREANERIRQSAEDLQFGGLVPFICECPRLRCREITQLAAAVYDEVRAQPKQFIISSVHDGQGAPELRVVRKNSRFSVIETLGPEALGL